MWSQYSNDKNLGIEAECINPEKQRNAVKERRVKINSESLKFIGKQLPWIIGLLPKDAGSFRVEIVDLDLLSLSPEEDWSAVSRLYHAYDRILLIDGTGKAVGEVGVKTKQIRDLVFTWEFPFIKFIYPWWEVSFPESVEQAIARIGKPADDVRYILHIGKSDPTPQVVLHQLPKKIASLREWIAQKADEQANQLQAKLAEADSE